MERVKSFQEFLNENEQLNEAFNAFASVSYSVEEHTNANRILAAVESYFENKNRTEDSRPELTQSMEEVQELLDSFNSLADAAGAKTGLTHEGRYNDLKKSKSLTPEIEKSYKDLEKKWSETKKLILAIRKEEAGAFKEYRDTCQIVKSAFDDLSMDKYESGYNKLVSVIEKLKSFDALKNILK